MKSNGAYQRVSQGTYSGSSDDSNVARATPIVVTGAVVSNHSVVSPPPAMAAASSSSSTTTTTTLSTSSPSTLYRTKCDVNTIPLVARNMTWSDSFYENISYDADEIIAVFDIDRTVYNIKYMTLLMYIFMFILVVITFGILFLFLIVLFFIENDRRSNMFRLQRTHIAITNNGIYIDEVDTPGSTNLMSRTLIKFSDIKECKGITEYGWTEQSISHKIFLSTKQQPTARFITGIKQQQKFVDIVNAMMLQTTFTTETVATVEEQTNVATTTSVATTNKDVIAVAEIV